MNELRFVECDAELRRRVGQAVGDVVERHIRLDDGFAFVALDGATPVGVLAVLRQRLPEPAPETVDGFINVIEVAEAYRRRGIARRLVALSIERCRRMGLYQLRAWSSVDKHEAISLWRRLGFTLCPGIELHTGQEIRGFLVAHRL